MFGNGCGTGLIIRVYFCEREVFDDAIELNDGNSFSDVQSQVFKSPGLQGMTHQHAIDHVVHQGLYIGHFGGMVFIRHTDDHSVACLGGHMLDAIEHGGEEGCFQIGDDDANGMGGPIDKALGECVGLVVQRMGEFADAILGGIVEVGMVVQCTGNRGHIDAGYFCDIPEGYLSGRSAGFTRCRFPQVREREMKVAVLTEIPLLVAHDTRLEHAFRLVASFTPDTSHVSSDFNITG